jgi:uncharacterized protein
MKTKLKRIIADFHQAALPVLFRRELEVPLDLDKIITIIGPRRAGKTFFLYQIMSDLEKKGVPRSELLYLNFEDERLELGNDSDLIFDSYRELYPHQDLSRIYIFFDEIQGLPNWEKFVRRVSDTLSRHIFLTGSNSKLLSKEIATSLRGRSISFEILPLSFKEFLHFQNLPTDATGSSRDRALIENAFEQYCLWGGFPELVSIKAPFKAQVLQEYFNVMLYRDLVERYQIRDTAVLKVLLKRLIASFTKEFSVNRLYNDLKSRGFAIGKDSLYKMMEEVFAIYMLASVERYDPSVVRREMSNKKVYLYDNGFATALHYSFAEDRGKLLENLVFRTIRAMTEEIYFLRDNWECDFAVFPMRSEPQLIQVTEQLNRENVNREIKGFQSGKAYFGKANTCLLTQSVEPGLDLPEWLKVMSVQEWLLSQEMNGW